MTSSKKRIYLSSTTGIYSKFCDFHEYKPNHMKISIYGLASKKAKIKGQFPDKFIDCESTEEIKQSWKDYKPLGKQFDSISIHKHGPMNFSVKIVPDTGRLLPLSASSDLNQMSPTFLKFQFMSDNLKQYTFNTHRIKEPCLTISTINFSEFTLVGLLSGKDYAIEKDMQHIVSSWAINEISVYDFDLDSFKVMFACIPCIRTAGEDKPKGTIASLFLLAPKNQYLVKSFVIG